MADLIVRGRTVITMDGERRVLEDAAVAVSDGHIVDVGERREVEARNPAPERVIGDGRHAVLPGLIDAHGHAGHSLIKSLGADRPDIWMSVVTPLYFTRTTAEFWRLDGMLSALDRLRCGVTTSMSVMGSRPRADDASWSFEHASGYAQVGVADVIGLGPSGTPMPHHFAVAGVRRGTWEPTTASLQDMLDVTRAVIEQLDGARQGLTRVFVTPFTILPSLYPSGPSTPHQAVRATEADRAHGAAVRELAASTGTRIHSDAFGGHIRLAMQDPETAILGPQVHLQHCQGISEEEIALLASTGTHVSHAPGGALNVPSLLAHGANVAVTTDGSAPTRPFDLLQAARAVKAAHQVRTGDPYLFPPGKLLEMITIDAARAMGMESQIGSIEVGKRADLILIDTEQPHLTPWWMPVHRVVHQALGQDVETVIVAGRVLMEDREVTTVDPREVVREAQAMAESTLAAAGLTSHLGEPGWGEGQRVFA